MHNGSNSYTLKFCVTDKDLRIYQKKTQKDKWTNKMTQRPKGLSSSLGHTRRKRKLILTSCPLTSNLHPPPPCTYKHMHTCNSRRQVQIPAPILGSSKLPLIPSSGFCGYLHTHEHKRIIKNNF